MYIELDAVRKSYGEGGSYVQVLDGVSLGVQPGEMCVVLGPSGSGKSTLLNTVGGLDRVDSGSIRIDGTDITALRPAALADYRRKTIGFVFQLYHLIPNLTVQENIEVCRYLSPEPLDLDMLLDVMDMRGHRHKFPAQLSGGQQQRCAIARALVKRPKLLLCDEPTGALDSKTAKEILILLETVNRTYGTTMLIVTHNERIGDMVDRVIRIRDGRIERIDEQAKRVSARDLAW